jgi:hypothetical protein
MTARTEIEDLYFDWRYKWGADKNPPILPSLIYDFDPATNTSRLVGIKFLERARIDSIDDGIPDTLARVG